MFKLFIIFLCCFYNTTQSRKVVLLSISTFPSIFVNKDDTPTLMELIKKGVSSLKFAPVFPTVSLPNQQTIITGLSVESHGIVNERIKIPKDSKKGEYISDFSRNSLERAWWDINGNIRPLFTANELADPNHKSSSIFWPGEAVNYANHQISKFEKSSDPKVDFSERIKRAIKDLMDHNLVVVYVEDLSTIGIKFGPYSSEVKNIVKKIDNSIKDLVQAVENETDTDLIITSDHGLTNEIKDYKRDFFEYRYAAEHFDYENFGAMVTIFPIFQEGKYAATPEEIVTELNLFTGHNFIAYLKKDIPSYLNYSKSERIAPVVIMFETGYILPLFSQGGPWKGYFGWPVEKDPLMNGIFIAFGPSFNKSHDFSEIKNVDIYGIVCKILDIEKACHPSNGTKEFTVDLQPKETTSSIPPSSEKTSSNPTSVEQNSSNYALEIALPIVLILILIAVIAGVTIKKVGVRNISQLFNSKKKMVIGTSLNNINTA